MKQRYTVILEKEDDGGYHLFCPTLPGCHSQGKTVEEALANIKEAIELYLESLIAHGEAVPEEPDLIVTATEVEARASTPSA
jgi:predicted RNase H-like HicB family nuclease